MAYLIDDNAMRICIRPRPWHPEKELPFISQPVTTPFFLGGGNFASAPRKPAAGGALREIVAVIDNRQIDFDKPEEGAELRRGMGGGGRRYKNRRYVFDHVFRMEAGQEEVYENTAKPLLEGVLNGYNATVFAYGATGCGKTHTISGSPVDPGIIVLTMRDLFNRIEETKDKYDTHLELSMVELYNEQIRDLLSDNFPFCPTGGLKLLENEKERVTIADVTIKRPQSVEEVLDLVMLGNERRSTSATNANNQSSRSHAVLQINVTRSSRAADVDMDRETVLQDTSSATLSIVDLAGSERASATHNMGKRMKEGAKINQSLLALSSCISALCAAQRSRSRPHVPYRNSKLTRLLKFSLGGNCRTVMIVCVSPSSRDMEDTSNTLTWANKAKDVKMRVTRNVGGHEVSTRQYLEKIAEQGERIKILEGLLEKRDKENLSASTSKLEDGRKRVTDVMYPIIAKVDKALAEIQQGAEQRARWDGAELGATSLTLRSNELGDNCGTEKEFCEQIIAWYNDAYRNSRAVQSKVRRENELVGSIETSLSSLETRSFPEMDAANNSNLKLQIELQRARYKAAIAEARETGYRASLACAMESLAHCAAAFVNLKTGFSEYRDGFESMTARGTAPVGDLERILDTFELRVNEAKDEVADTFRAMTVTDSAPSQPIRPASELVASDIVAMPPPPPPPQQVGFASPSSPAVKRLLAASEKKGGYHVKAGSPRAGGSPRKQRAKATRFGDETGEGELESIHIFRPGSSQSMIDIKALDIDDESVEWEEMKDEIKPLAGPLGRGATRVPSLTSSPAPFKVLPIPASAPAPAPAPAPTSSTSTATDFDSLPEWKKNRILLGRASSNALSATGGTNSVSPPEPSPTGPTGKTTPIGLGKPSRPPSRASPALAELHQIPSSSRGLSSSTLLRPTAASAARAGQNGCSDKPAPPTGASPLSQSVSEHRRLSVTRRERSKLHKSGVPYKRKSSLAGSPGGSPNTSISPTRGGVSASTLSASTMRAPTRPPIRMRGSVLGADTSMSSAGDTSAVGLHRSLRHSMSISALGNGYGAPGSAGLRARPSMQHLGGTPASRPAWK